MPLASPSSSSWYLPRFSPEEMDAALSSFQARELQELSSSHIPLFDLTPGIDDSSIESSGLDFYIDHSDDEGSAGASL